VQQGQTAPSHPTSEARASAIRAARTKAPDPGEILEARVAQLWYWEGFYSRSAVDLTRHFHPEPLQITDLDLLAFDFNPQLSRSKYIGEVKSGTGKSAPKALDRLIWLRGLRELVGAESGELTIAAPPSDRTREMARALGLVAQSVQDFERREQESVTGLADCGAHGPSGLLLRLRARDTCRTDPELERAHGFLRSGVWFLEPFTAIKQTVELLRRIKRRWDPRMQDDEAQALRWLLAESASVLTLNLVTVSGLSLTLERLRFSQLVNDRLAEGMIPMPQMRRLSDSIDKYVNGVLSAANIPADVRTSAIGAFLPEPPDWADPLTEVAWRLGRSAPAARSLPRQIDLLVFERVARLRDVPEQAARRVGLERHDATRLRNLLAAFLRGCDASPDVLNDALVTAIPLTAPAAEHSRPVPSQQLLYPEQPPTSSEPKIAP
jgi:hypothetical protein